MRPFFFGHINAGTQFFGPNVAQLSVQTSLAPYVHCMQKGEATQLMNSLNLNTQLIRHTLKLVGHPTCIVYGMVHKHNYQEMYIIVVVGLLHV